MFTLRKYIFIDKIMTSLQIRPLYVCKGPLDFCWVEKLVGPVGSTKKVFKKYLKLGQEQSWQRQGTEGEVTLGEVTT